MNRIDFLRRTVRIMETITETDGIVYFDDTKSPKSRRVLDLPLFLIGMLAEHIHDSNIGADDLLFRGPAGGPLRYSNFRCRVFNPAVRQAALTGCSFHTLRQSAAGLMREVGA